MRLSGETKIRSAGSTTDPRRLAWQILQRVEDGAYADVLLGTALAAGGLSPRDQSLAVRLVYGCLAWQGYLDHLAGSFSKKGIGQLDVPIRCLLRLGLLQICKLSRVPAFAAVNHAVELAKEHRGGAASGFVNAVLRRAAREWQAVEIPHDSPASKLAVELSHPRWLVEHWLAEYGLDETTALLQANNEAAPTTVRINPRQATPAQVGEALRGHGCRVTPCRYAPAGLILEATGALPALATHRDGWMTPQGEASQLVGLLAAPAPGSRVLDACAAPGGKTTHLAEAMDDRGTVIALDTHASGVAAIQRQQKRLGLTCIDAQVADATAWQAAPGSFDTILVDAPCSGLGTLRQHPEIRWRRSAQSIHALASTQSRLLAHLAELVRPGGTLVYATCTLVREENEHQVRGFLAAHGDFVIADPRPHLPPEAHELCGSDGMVRMQPHRHGLDGFFAARLHRRL